MRNLNSSTLELRTYAFWDHHQLASFWRQHWWRFPFNLHILLLPLLLVDNSTIHHRAYHHLIQTLLYPAVHSCVLLFG